MARTLTSPEHPIDVKNENAMRKPPIQFDEIADEIRHVTLVRDQLVLAAFDALESRHVELAQTLLENLGSRQRAAHWMCTNQRAFDGSSAYDVLADGDEDRVWDQLPGGEPSPATRMQKVGLT